MSGEVILTNTEDGGTQLRLPLVDGAVWLSPQEIAGSFEAVGEAVIKESLITGTDGKADVARLLRSESHRACTT